MEKMDRMDFDRIEVERMAGKWGPVVEGSLEKIGTSYCKNLVTDISCYMEWRARQNDGELPEHLRQVYENVKNADKRSKIVGEFYNHVTGKIDLLLENGTYVPKENQNPTLELEELMHIFPEEFLAVYRHAEYREWKLDQIL